MKKIVLTRIDDRLIHGQFVTAWLKYIKADVVLIIDTELANDTIMKRIYIASLPPHIDLLIYNFCDTKKFFNEDINESQNIIILVKSPKYIEHLINTNIHIKDVNLGGMGATVDREKFFRNIYASKDEINCMNRILEYGTTIHYQLVPNDKSLDISKLLNERSKL